MVEWEAGSNIWYQTLILKQSLTEIQVHFPRAWILLVWDWTGRRVWDALVVFWNGCQYSVLCCVHVPP